MTHLDVFDPPTCCSTGVCDPSADPQQADLVVRTRRSHEAVHRHERATQGRRTVLEPWHADVFAAAPVGA